MSKQYLLQFPFIPHDKWEPVEVELTPDERLTTCTAECMGYVRIINDTLRQVYCQKFQTEGKCTNEFVQYILRKNAENPIESSDLIDLNAFIKFFSKHLYKNYITIVGLVRSGDIGHSVTVYKDNSNNIWIRDPQVRKDYVCILNPKVEEEKRKDTITDYLTKYYIGFSVYVQSNKRLLDKNITGEENEFEPRKKQKILSRAEDLQESLAKYHQDSQVQDHQSSQVEPETKQTTISRFPSNLNEEPALFSMGKSSKTRNNQKKHKGTKKKVGNGKTKKQKTKKQKTKTKKQKTKTKKQKPKNLKIR